MSLAHLYVFCDACPTDWLTDDQDDKWHTIVYLVFQSDPTFQSLVDQGERHEVLLDYDSKYAGLIKDLQTGLPAGQLRKWKSGKGYRKKFCSAYTSIVQKHRPLITACSFQEKTLRDSQQALLNSYNHKIGGIEGRGIAFEQFTDGKGRSQMKHSFVNFHGYHEIQAPANQMLVLLLMSWIIADQYTFYSNDIVCSGRYGFDGLGISVVSDKLSGDDDFRRKSEMNLRNLLDPEHENVPVVLTRSKTSDKFSADLIVDNLAGWLNAAMTDPTGEYASFVLNLAETGAWKGWHQLLASTTELKATPAVARLSVANLAEPNSAEDGGAHSSESDG